MTKSKDAPIARYIRTDFVFSHRSKKREKRDQTNLCVAFLNKRQDLDKELRIEFPVSPSVLPEHIIEIVLRSQEEDVINVARLRRELFDPSGTGVLPSRSKALLDHKIVIENSPPTVEVLRQLFQTANDVGFNIVGAGHGYSLIAVALLPIGRIVMGAAKGVSDGLQKGFSS